MVTLDCVHGITPVTRWGILPRRNHYIRAVADGVRAWVRVALAGAVGAGLLLVAPGSAAADTDDEAALAERFAPVMAMVRQAEDCGPGDPYQPSAVDPLFGSDSVALRGPWTDRDLVDVGPSAAELGGGLPGYSLDYPPNPLQPGCSYESWARSVWGSDAEPTIYAHVATQRRPSRSSSSRCRSSSCRA